MRTGEITVDSKGNTMLWFRKHDHVAYMGSEDEDGVITLIPAARVPAWRVEDPDVDYETEMT